MTDAARSGDPGAVAVVGAAPGPGWDLACALAGSGEHVGFVGAPGADRADAVPPGVVVAGTWDGRLPADLANSLARCAASPEGLRAAVFAWAPEISTTPAPFSGMDESSWQDACEAPIRRCLTFMQGVHAYFDGRPGSLVVLIPTIAMLGPPAGLVAWAAAAEGQRTMVKTAARNWGGVGLRTYAIAVTPVLLLASDPPDPEAPRLRVGLPPQSFPDRPSIDDVARVVTTVTGPGFGAVTGSTVGVDGGQWMVA